MFEYIWKINIKPLLSKFNIMFHPPWSTQCRKFDLHVLVYTQPISTLSLGLTIPFLFCLYLSIGIKLNWWHRKKEPPVNGYTYGLWLFVGSMMASAILRTTDHRLF